MTMRLRAPPPIYQPPFIAARVCSSPRGSAMREARPRAATTGDFAALEIVKLGGNRRWGG